MKQDRISRAWELRRDIHAWLMLHPNATAPEIYAAFPNPNTTLKNSVCKLRADGDVVISTVNNRSTYAAVRPVVSAFEALQAALEPHIINVAPGHTRYMGGQLPRGTCQGGQGGDYRPRGFTSLAIAA